MTKVIEILFRRKWGLLVLLMLPILVSSVIAFKQPRMYQASAGLWALRRYEIIGATGPEADLNSTPAQTQVTTVTELLQSRSFALAVAYDTALPAQLGAKNPGTQNLQDALYNEISGNVQATVIGYNLFDITYTNTDAAVALQVVKAVVLHFGLDSGSQSTDEADLLLTSYKTQLVAAQKQATSANQAAAQYLQTHQLSALQAGIDPKYQLLTAQANQADAAVVTLQNDINTVNQQLAAMGTGASGLYTVIDSPSLPSRPVSRTKTVVLTGAIGLAIGLIVAIVYFLILLRLDESLYTLADLPAGVSYPVLIQIPQVNQREIAKDSRAKAKLLPKWGT